jgi:hypothetical protein
MKRKNLFVSILFVLLSFLISDVGAQLLPSSSLKDADDEAIMQSWLGSNYYGVKIYTKSIDGASGNIFHQKCDGQGPTITLIRNSQNNVVFGGYSNGDWSGYPNKGGTGSFVFNLATNTKLDYIGPGLNATYPNYNYGPIFINSFEVQTNMSQIYAGGNQSYYCNSGYTICADLLFNSIGQNTLSSNIPIGEVEVYKVVSNDILTLNLVQPNIIAQCPGSSLNIPIVIQGNFGGSSANYEVIWSDVNGIFAFNPTSSQSISISNNTDFINVTVPAAFQQNGNYKVKIRSQSSGLMSNAVNVSTKSMLSMFISDFLNQNGNFLCQGSTYNIPFYLSDCVSGSTWTLNASLSSSSLGYNQVIATTSSNSGVFSFSIPSNVSPTGDYTLKFELNYNGQTYVVLQQNVQIGSKTTFTLNNFSGSYLCSGTLYSLNYNYTGCDLSSGNEYLVELSDINGSFVTSTVLGISTSQMNTGTIEFSLGSLLPTSANYRLRVRPTGMSSGNWVQSSTFTFGLLGNISINIPTSSSLCVGTYSLNYSTESTCPNAYSNSNVFTVQLSDANGSFTSPTSIGTLASSDPNGVIGFTIPNSLVSGLNYNIRVVSSAPQVTGSAIPVDIGMNLYLGVDYYTVNCTGYTDTWIFNTSGCPPTAGNVYTLEYFSNSTNTWVTASTLSSVSISGTITYTVPSTWAAGNYSFRLRSSAPLSYSQAYTTYLYPRSAEVIVDYNSSITSTFCPGSSMTVPFLRMGNCVLPATTGNIYRLQLSATSDFANPVTIGSLSSVASSGSIVGTIPAGYYGYYFLRIIGTAPATPSGGSEYVYFGPSNISLSVSLTDACPGEIRSIGFNTYSCPLGTGNQIIYELGDANGNFTNPIVLGTFATTAATATHSITIPSTVPGGLNYTIRVRSTVPARNSSYWNIYIGRKTSITSGVLTNYCQGQNYTHAYSYSGCALAAGNVFTAEICSSQNFSGPIYSVGSLTSTTVTGNVVVNIPATVPAGNYFLRIKSSNTIGATFTTYPIVVNGLIIDTSIFQYFTNCGIPNYLPYTFVSCNVTNPSIQFVVDISSNFSALNPVIYELFNGTVTALSGNVSLTLPSGVPLGSYQVRARATLNGTTSTYISSFNLQTEVQLNSNLLNGSTYWYNNSLNTFCGGNQFTLPQITYYSCGLTTVNQFNGFTATLKLQNLSNPAIPDQVIQTFTGTNLPSTQFLIPSMNFSINSNLNPGNIYRIILSPNTTVWSPISWEFIVTGQMTLTLPAGGNTFCPGSNVPLTVAMCSNPNSLNPLQVQLSNALGEFDNATVLSTITFQQFLNPPFNVQLPSNLVIGLNYYIRIKDTVTGWTSNSVSISVNGALSVTGVASNYCQGQTATLAYNYSCNLPSNNQFEVFITNTTKANSILLGTVNATNNSGTLSIAIPNSFTGGVGFKFWIKSIQNSSCQSELSSPFGIGLNTSLSYTGSICRGISVPVTYTATGCSLNPGNVFQVMLGDLVVGSLLSDQSSGTINVIIPMDYSGSSAQLRLQTSSPTQIVAQIFNASVQSPATFSVPTSVCTGASINIPFTLNCSLPSDNSIKVYNGTQLVYTLNSNISGNLNFSLPLLSVVPLKIYLVSASYNLLVYTGNLSTQSIESAFSISATPDFISGCGSTAQLNVDPFYPSAYSDNFETGPGSMWQDIEGENVYYTQVWVSGGWFSSGYYSTTYYYNHCAASGTRSLLFTRSYNRWATTKPMNVSNGGTVAFKLKISGDASISCENADAGEEVQLQYSVDLGTTWTSIATYNTTGTYNNLTAVSVAIPNAAKSYATMFRWKQISCDEYEGDNWVLDDVSISGSSLASFPCTWDNATSLSSATIKNPVATPNATTNYSVTISAVNFSCPVVKTITVTAANQIGVDLSKFTFFGTSGGKNYYTSDQMDNWTTANTNCINSCGNLVSINTAAEQTYVQTILPNQNRWIGANDATTEGTFVWTTGQTFATFTNWVSGTTTATGNSATNDHVLMNAITGKWQVGLGTTSLNYILEKTANQSLQISSNIPLSYCSGSQLTIGYSVQGVFDVGNVFQVQLSNSSGSFASPTIIGSVTANTSGTVLINIPSILTSASGYRLRLVSSSPAVTSPDNGTNLLIIGTSPQITSLSANAVQAGNQLTIFGNGFSISGNAVTISNQQVAIVTESPTQITVVVPGGLCPGNVSVLSGCGNSSNAMAFDPMSTPLIASTTESVIGGEIQVNIIGYGFTYSNNLITLGGVSYTPILQSPNLIRFNLPSVQCGQVLSITNACGIVSNNFNYSTQLQPVISSVTPIAFGVGDVLTIAGSRFSSAGNTVTYGNVTCSVLSQSINQLTIQLPSQVCSGVFVVTNGCGVSGTSGNYTVTLGVSNYYSDDDSDGFGNINSSISSCYFPVGYVLNSGDCNDMIASINPDASELCNNFDDDCDGTTDDGLTFVNYYVDTDGDGYGAGAASNLCSNPGTGYVSNNTDCNNNDAAVHAITIEVCNNLDDDCDGTADDGLTFVNYYLDTDGDGYGAGAASNLCSNPGAGYVTNNTDCNNSNAAVHSITTEVCNNFDDDCDGTADDDLTFVNYYVDTDGDGYGAGAASNLCSNPGSGYSTNADDCDDAVSTINPGATESCNDVDDDCNGIIDNNIVFTNYFVDNDGDGYGAGTASNSCSNLGAGFVTNNTDCNDANSTLNSITTEVCNNFDDDCDGTADDGLTFVNYYVDTDGDGYGAGAASNLCSNPGAGYVTNNTDCNDALATVYPGAAETCNTIDDDCDNSTDEGVQTTFYADADSDTYGDLATTTSACTVPVGYVSNSTDCNDASASVYPGATETCNSIDDDCDGSTDEGVQTTFYADADNDTFGDLATTTSACTAPAGYVSNSTDCNDGSASVHPSATETCNGVDDDCDNSTDESVQITFYLDADNDTYGDIATTTLACSVPAGYSVNSEDCDDSAAGVNPGATEVCGGTDEDCDGQQNEGLTFYNYYADNDGDTYAGTLIGNNCFTPIAAGYAAFSSDCQDSDPSIYPTAIELCYNIVDENCNGLINEGCGNLILGDDIYSSMSVSIANQFGTGAQPTSVLNLNIATDSPESYGAGSDMWILATPTSNAVRISLSGSTSVQDDNEISIYGYQPGLVGPMIPLIVEDAVQPNNLGVSLDGGNEVLLTDQLVPGVPIWICIRNTNGIPGVCKLQIANLQGSQTDIGPYTQYTGTFSNVCQNFKVKFRPKAIGYIVHRLENSDVNSNTSWLYAIPSGNGTVATTVCQLGKLVPANLTASSQTHYFKVDVNYSLKDAYGNDHSLIANGIISGSLVLNPESDLYLRSTDQCPVYKSLTGSIATNRSVCGSSSYNWSFTQTLPSPSPFDFAISGATSSRILPISVIPGIGQNQVYDVKIRAKHLSNVEYTNWGSIKCLRTTASAGMPLVVEQLDQSNTDAVVYPNPNGGEMFFLSNFNSHDYSDCQLLNSNGQLVKNWHLSDGQSVFELNGELSSGIYQIRMIGAERTQMLRLIVAK